MAKAKLQQRVANTGMKRTVLRYIVAGGFVLIAATFFALLAREFGWGVKRATPAFRTKGRADAPVVIDEFTDFQCPACRYAHERVKKITQIYGEDIRLSLKHFPFEFHNWAFTAAVCAECAGKQGRFWEYSDLLFSNQEKWSQSKETPAMFENFAKQLSLDLPGFASCRSDPDTARDVAMDSQEGAMRKVEATPTFFVNGKMVTGGKNLSDAALEFEYIIKRSREKRMK